MASFWPQVVARQPPDMGRRYLSALNGVPLCIVSVKEAKIARDESLHVGRQALYGDAEFEVRPHPQYHIRVALSNVHDAIPLDCGGDDHTGLPVSAV